jgi:hypothetical protein
MPRTVNQYRCLIISPSDVEEERGCLANTIASWNAHIGAVFGQVIEAVLWKLHSIPIGGDRPQSLFNPTVDACDLGIAVFWTKLGTPTGAHESGSMEEISRLQKSDRPILVYFCNRDVPRANLDPDEIERLDKFRDSYRQQGIFQEFTSTEELAMLATLHLTSVMARLAGISNVVPDVQTPKLGEPTLLTAPKPDVRVKVGSYRRMTPRPRGSYPVDAPRRVEQLAYIVTVENHSPVPVFISTIALEFETSTKASFDGLLALEDIMQQSFNQRIEAGDSFKFVYDKRLLLIKLGKDKLRAVLVFDKVGRRYETEAGEAERALRADPG